MRCGGVGCGLIASGTPYWLEARREKRERKKESQTRASMLRQAARLVDEEFLAASHSVEFAAQTKRWGNVLIFKPTTISWEKYRTVLVMELSISGGL